MASHAYPRGFRRLAEGSKLWKTDPVKSSLVRGLPGFNGAHVTMADILAAGGSIVASNTLAQAGKDINDSAADVRFQAGDSAYGNVAAGAAIPHEIIWFDTGDMATSEPIALLDTADGTADGQPLVPDGGPVTTSWPSWVFRLVTV